MRFAIVESGGKQYRAIEGQTIEVDRLPVEAGKKFDVERVLLMSDGDDVLVGTPLISDILVKVTVVDHTKGPKIDRFKYRPKKRIRVRGGHRQQERGAAQEPASPDHLGDITAIPRGGRSGSPPIPRRRQPRPRRYTS